MRTVTSSPSSAWIRCVSCSGVVPSAAAAWTASSWPSLSSSFCAVGTSKIANVAPPIELRSPYLAMPDDLELLRRAERGDADPVAELQVLVVGDALVDGDLAVAAGQRPSTRLSGLKRSYSGAVSMPNANAGAPPVSIASPSGRSSFVWKSWTEPVATSTPSTARTRSSVSSGIGGAWADSPSKLMPASLPVTTASVPAYESTKIASNALSIVSVRT